MPLDHYVSQVHLRGFYSPALGERMHAVRKKDNHAFTCASEDVCRTRDGSTNDYLVEPRLIEEFLLNVEPFYNHAVQKLRAGEPTTEVVHVIAGFAAFVATCSPSAMRQASELFRSSVEATTNMLDRRGAFGEAPETLRGKSISERVEDGSVVIDVDQKFPQAVGITNVLGIVSTFGNSRWEILRNSTPSSPFFTSDFPVAIEQSSDPRVMNRIVPLAPDIAMRIHPDLGQARDTDLSFKAFRFIVRSPKASEIRAINRQIVRCAESLVFFRDDRPWVRPFIAKHSGYWIEAKSEKIPTPDSIYVLNGLRVRERPKL